MTQSEWKARIERIEAVRVFVRSLPDGHVLAVCAIYARGGTDGDARKMLRLSESELDGIKAGIAQGLLDAGVTPRK